MTALLELPIFYIIHNIIVDGQVLAILLEAILENYNELISKITQDYYDYNCDDYDVLHFELAGCRYYFYCLQQ